MIVGKLPGRNRRPSGLDLDLIDYLPALRMVVLSPPPSYTSTNPSEPSSTRAQPSYTNPSRSTAGHSSARRFVYIKGSTIRILVLTTYPNFAAVTIPSIRIRMTHGPQSLTRLKELHSSTPAATPMGGSTLSQKFPGTRFHPHRARIANAPTTPRGHGGSGWSCHSALSCSALLGTTPIRLPASVLV